MQFKKYMFILLSAVFLLGFSGFANALPLMLYDVEISDWEYDPEDKEYEFKVEGKSDNPENWDNRKYLIWEFEISNDDGEYEFKSKRWRANYKGEGDFVNTEFEDLGGGNFYFEAQFESDELLSILSGGKDLFVSGSFTKNSPFTKVAIQVHTKEATPLPEPGTLLLVGIGLVGLAGIGRNKFLKR